MVGAFKLFREGCLFNACKLGSFMLVGGAFREGRWVMPDSDLLITHIT